MLHYTVSPPHVTHSRLPACCQTPPHRAGTPQSITDNNAVQGHQLPMLRTLGTSYIAPTVTTCPSHWHVHTCSPSACPATSTHSTKKHYHHTIITTSESINHAHIVQYLFWTVIHSRMAAMLLSIESDPSNSPHEECRTAFPDEDTFHIHLSPHKEKN